MVTALLVILAMVAAAGWRWRAVTSRAGWARTIAAPEIQRLLNHGDYADAFLLARQALDVVPDDPHLGQLWIDASMPAAMTTDPAGRRRGVGTVPDAHDGLVSPRPNAAQGVRIPRGHFRVRISKPGFETIEGSGAPGALQRYRLDPTGAAPPDMVRVVGGRDPVRFGAMGDLDDFWIDRFEVTNRQFKEFVDQGGYRRRDYWRSRSPTAADPCHGKRRSPGSATRPVSRGPRRGLRERSPRARPTSRSEA